VSAFLACYALAGSAIHAESFRGRLSLPAAITTCADLGPDPCCSAVVSGDVTTAHDEDRVVVLAGHARRLARDRAGAAVDAPIDAKQLSRMWKVAGRPAVHELQGEYALLHLDRHTGTLELLVDRFGMSSLYLRRLGEQLWLCTEPLPLGVIGPKATVDLEALPDVFSLRVLTGRRSLWEGVRQVVPGQWLTLSANETIESPPVPCYRFAPRKSEWAMADAAAQVAAGIRRSIERLRDEGVAEVAVPLSGGVDSTIIAAIARTVFPKCRGFTMSMEGFANPEVPRAQEVARRIGIPLTVFPVTDQHVRSRFPKVIARLQEPPRHFNNMPMLCMLEEIAQHASVILAGDGGDQFGTGVLGASLRLSEQKRALDRVPLLARPLIAALVTRAGGARGARLGVMLQCSLPELIQQTELIEATAQARSVLGESIGDGYPTADTLSRTFFSALPVDEMITVWVTTSLGRAINRRNTRLGQQVGVRFVYPLLDPSLQEIAATLPVEMRFDLRAGLSKPVLRRVCADLVGEDVSVWPKFGFATPDVEWIEGPLRDVYHQAFGVGSELASLFDLQRLRALPIRPNKKTIWTIMTMDAVLRQASSVSGGSDS